MAPSCVGSAQLSTSTEKSRYSPAQNPASTGICAGAENGCAGLRWRWLALCAGLRCAGPALASSALALRWRLPALALGCAGAGLRWDPAALELRWRWAALALSCAGAGPRWNHSIPIAHRRELLPAATACPLCSLACVWHGTDSLVMPRRPLAACSSRAWHALNTNNTNNSIRSGLRIIEPNIPVSQSQIPSASSTLAQRSPVAGGCAGIVLRCALGCAGGSALGLRWRWAALALACAVRWAALGILRWGCAGAGAALVLACAGAELRWGNMRWR